MTIYDFSLIFFSCLFDNSKEITRVYQSGVKEANFSRRGRCSGLWAAKSGTPLRCENINTQYSRLQSCRCYYSKTWFELRSQSAMDSSAADVDSFPRNFEENIGKGKTVHVKIQSHIQHDPLIRQSQRDETLTKQRTRGVHARPKE